MANILLPIVTTWLALGKTVDITKYKLGNYYTESIFNETGFVESQADILNSTYYVLPDSKLPYSAMGMPIDLVLRINSGGYQQGTQGIPEILDFRGYDSAVVLFVLEYRTVDRSLNEDAVPVPDWQKTTPKSYTHYVEKMHYGGRCIALLQKITSVPGDAQIVRRILTEVMGSSGQVTSNTLDLWEKAGKAIDESPDLRGYVYTKQYSIQCNGIFPPLEAFWNVEGMLRYMPDLSKFVFPYDRQKTPASVSLKPLHSLDKQYPAVEKNVKTEEYLKKVDDMLGDLKYAYDKLQHVIDEFPWSLRIQILTDRDSIFAKLEEQIENTQYTLIELTLGDISLYKDINITAFNNAFELYQNGLDKASDSYYSAVKKLDEDLAVQCENKFLKPTEGFLKVHDSEVTEKVLLEGGLEECQQYCENDKRCRAVGYANTTSQGKGELCWIYYRSTYTSTINVPTEFSGDMKIYDRSCTKPEL